MKKLRSRIISIVLTLTLVLSMTATPVSYCAAATKSSSKTTSSTTKTTTSTSQKYTACKTYKAAAKQLRSNMVKRKRYTRVKYTFTSKTPKQLARNFSAKVYKQAVAHTGVPNEGDYLQWNNKGYTASWTLTRNTKTNKYTVSVEFDMNYRTTAKEESAVTNEVDRILTSLGLKTSSTNDNKTDKKKNTRDDYAKIRAIYDYVITHVTYSPIGESDPKNFTAYKAAIQGEAVCQGYALLIYRLMLETGIPCRIITADALDGLTGHAWNIVKLDDKWYNIDATWDSKGYDHRYFLCGTQDFGHELFPLIAENVSNYTIEPYRYIK